MYAVHGRLRGKSQKLNKAHFVKFTKFKNFTECVAPFNISV